MIATGDSEPWQAPGQTGRLVIGARVRVLAWPECFYCRDEGESETGVLGNVVSVGDPVPAGRERGAETHIYWVEADEFPCGTSHFAAAELEPLARR